MVDCLEDLNVKVLCFGRVEGDPERHERIREPVDADADRTMAHVRVAGLDDRVVVHVDDAVQVERDDLGNLVKLLEVVLVAADERRESERGKVTDGSLIRRRVLDNLRAEIRGFDRSQVLLVRLACRRMSKSLFTL